MRDGCQRLMKELLELPGIGTYTAAAIASLVFDEDVLAVDGNVKSASRRGSLHCPVSLRRKEAKEKLLPLSSKRSGGRV